MAIAGAARRPLVACLKSHAELVPIAPTSLLHHVHMATRAPKSNIRSRNPKTVKRFIPEDVKRFVRPDGKLLTNRENRDFLLEHDLEPDNGRMMRFSAGPELARLERDFSATFAYSHKHVIHPYDLRFFEPRGHPISPMKRTEYARKKQDQAMWIFVTSVGGASAVVRTLTQRRLTRSLYQALDELGYRPTPGSDEGEKIRGTLWITLHNPTKAAGQPPERFGRVIADALAKHCSRQRR